MLARVIDYLSCYVWYILYCFSQLFVLKNCGEDKLWCRQIPQICNSTREETISSWTIKFGLIRISLKAKIKCLYVCFRFIASFNNNRLFLRWGGKIWIQHRAMTLTIFLPKYNAITEPVPCAFLKPEQLRIRSEHFRKVWLIERCKVKTRILGVINKNPRC